jgi:hypothetical protein
MLSSSAEKCLPQTCFQETKIWNIHHVSRFQVHGPNEQNLCRISHYKKKSDVSTLHICHFPKEGLPRVAKYFYQTTSATKRDGVSHALSGGRIVAVVGGSQIADPTVTSQHCEKYFIYHKDRICHKIISGREGNFEPVDCARLESRYNFVNAKE